jgi:hypothetical protein
MRKSSRQNYKGIAVFGAPGTGKTTIARFLLTIFPGAKFVEASETVIYPAIAIKDKLPAEEKSFVRLVGNFKKILSRSVPREEARDFFIRLKNKYTSSVIAKTIIYLHHRKFPKKFLIVSGIRGYKNSIHFKKSGYLVVYLKTPDRHAIGRLARRESFSRQSAEKESAIEERLFSTNKVEKIAHLSFNTAVTGRKEIAAQVKALVEAKECRRCINSSVNLSNSINKAGLCDVCAAYEANFSKEHLKKEMKFLMSLKGSGKGKYDALVGISGGKDSTAMLYEVKKMGFTPYAFTLDTGYYPKHIFRRAKLVAEELGVDHSRIDARKYMRPVDRQSFRKTADLYDEYESPELREKFRKWYVEGRRHYSVKCGHSLPFVRTCQLCRRLVIRAYYGEALKRGVQLVIIGINEWAGLSQDSKSKKIIFSAIRKLKPFKDKPAVYVVHLPFLLQRKIGDTRKVLNRLGWKIPPGEAFVESNANSCLFARAAENKARRLLGFHPDATRLAREVTVGFVTKSQARKAIAKIHNYPYSVRSVLKKAGVM